MHINVTGNPITQEEQQAYINRAMEKYGEALEGMDIHVHEEEVEINYRLKAKPFERLRRITGYLVGSMSRWNDAKSAEEHDRVKHGMEEFDV